MQDARGEESGVLGSLSTILFILFILSSLPASFDRLPTHNHLERTVSADFGAQLLRMT
jgi:hypothetical protein